MKRNFLRKRFSVKDRGSNETLGRLKRISRCIRRVEVNAFQTDKSSAQVSAVP